MIGTMAIALGKLFGLKLIVTCGTDDKCARIADAPLIDQADIMNAEGGIRGDGDLELRNDRGCLRAPS